MQNALQKSIGVGLLVLMLSFLLSPITAFAETKDNGYKGDKLNSTGDPLRGLTITPAEGSNAAPTVELPNVQIEQAKEFVEKKGFDIVGLLQTFAQPFSIGLFIFGAFLALMGAFGKSSAVMKGVLVMGLAVLVYAAVVAAPELMDFGNSWLNS